MVSKQNGLRPRILYFGPKELQFTDKWDARLTWLLPEPIPFYLSTLLKQTTCYQHLIPRSPLPISSPDEPLPSRNVKISSQPSGISFTELASKQRSVLRKNIPILSKTSTSNSATSTSPVTQQLRKLLIARCALATSVHSL